MRAGDVTAVAGQKVVHAMPCRDRHVQRVKGGCMRHRAMGQHFCRTHRLVASLSRQIEWRNFTLEPVAHLKFSVLKIKLRLQIHPRLRFHTEESPKSKRSVR